MNTAGAVVIGNEILSGKVSEINANYLATELRKLGVDLRSIVVVPDEVVEIGKVVAAASDRFDYVFTTGGVGPTHDDVTLEGIARGLDVKTIRNDEFERILRKHYGAKINDHVLRMADLPDGARLLWEDEIPIPVVCIRNIYIFPGDPDLLRMKFEAVRHRFQASPYHLRRIFTTADEGEIAPLLEDAVKAHPRVEIGSYPVYAADRDYRVQVTVESRDPEETRRATEFLKERMPRESILRVE